MAFDGITINSIVTELREKLTGGRVDKIYQPESDEIIMSVRSLGKNYKLLLTANPSHPRLHLTGESRENPQEPPLFCMVLRKHIQGGKILDITQPNFDRIVNIKIEALNEMGDYTLKTLILEIMGRHSNLMLVDEDMRVLECARHVSFDKSSVRQMLPGREYTMPPDSGKTDTLALNEENFADTLSRLGSEKAFAAIYKGYNGISPVIADEICHNALVDADRPVNTLDDSERQRLYASFADIVYKIKNALYTPQIVRNGDKITDMLPFAISKYAGCDTQVFSSPSEMTEAFYSAKDTQYRLNQKTHDLKHLIGQNIERCIKKRDIQQKSLKDIENREYLRLCGELITANIYAIKQGMTTVRLVNFYSENGEETEIELDGALTPAENAQKYFKRYNKAKRTFDALQQQTVANDEELAYLESVMTSVSACENEQDIKEIRRELREQGYIKKEGRQKGRQSAKKSAPLHFVSSDGYDIYVGKNNIQNDELTLRTAHSTDIWMHTKNIPGSHVIIITRGADVPDTTLTEAATLAAYYSKAQSSSMVPVDYTQRKNVHKPNGAKPGFVIYDTNKTAYITPSEEAVKKIKMER
ncbi:MAG: NFACT family protein [Firmicutes bacterium]|nr:NFACT family protein [Bacillota bacterium]